MHVLQPGETLDDALAPYAAVDRNRRGGWVMANMVGGLDGCAAVGGRVGALSDPPDKALFESMRALADVVLVGAETVRREGYAPISLPAERVAARKARGLPATPPVAVVTGSLELDWSAPVFADAPPESRTIVVTSSRADPERVRQAREVADVVVAGEDRVDPHRAIAELRHRGLSVVLCEGGPRLLGELVATSLLDELCLTIAPLMGGDPLPVSVTPPGAGPTSFRLRHVLAEEDTLFLRYERVPDGG